MQRAWRLVYIYILSFMQRAWRLVYMFHETVCRLCVLNSVVTYIYVSVLFVYSVPFWTLFYSSFSLIVIFPLIYVKFLLIYLQLFCDFFQKFSLIQLMCIVLLHSEIVFLVFAKEWHLSIHFVFFFKKPPTETTHKARRKKVEHL